ncbi:hypothetical protein G9464_02770 [Halostella sp. JP-L12]|uniref:hypothetical protein n=1 Tax=Halostella TaxID=1843185 RepID=UPI000EF7F4A7|nr:MULTISPECIES: hypothetical protein [Halostella]NHN46520.1 hypothetical protein [Halostella sp. JP-L12]
MTKKQKSEKPETFEDEDQDGFEELEAVVDDRIQTWFEKQDIDIEDLENDSSTSMARRGVLGMLGGSVLGLGLQSGSAAAQGEVRESMSVEATTQSLQADQITTSDVDGIRYAETADEIQPAIDELAEPNGDGSRGGIVKLGAKVYKPETTIWLKAGVTLEGVETNRHFNHRNHPEAQATVLSTENLGSEATFRHNGDHPHDHYPVVANYRTPPMELANRDPTDEELTYWGHNVGLRNIIIDASEKKYYKSGYFGAYDATLFSRSDNLRLENVETRNFDGYGLFLNGCRGVRDLGGRYEGGATDFHCNAVTLHTAYPPDPTVYTTGIFDLEAVGPAPTMETFTHGVKFVSGGWSQARIEETEPRFIGSESDYYAGNAPLTNTEDSTAIWKHEHGHADMDGYTIEGKNGNADGVWCQYNHANISNTSISNVRYGYRLNGMVPARISNCHFSNTEAGISCETHIPNVNGLTISNSDAGVLFNSGRANQYGTLSEIIFSDVDYGLKGFNSKQVVVNNPDFRGCGTAVDVEFDELELNNPVY